MSAFDPDEDPWGLLETSRVQMVHFTLVGAEKAVLAAIEGLKQVPMFGFLDGGSISTNRNMLEGDVKFKVSATVIYDSE